jgi:hypothetical protein
MRSFAEQDALYAQGRTKPGKIVTKARGGFSNHNFGVAFDIGVFKGGSDPEKAKTFVPESPLYKVIGLSAPKSVSIGAVTGPRSKTSHTFSCVLDGQAK